MKKLLYLFMVAMCATMFTACSKEGEENPTNEPTKATFSFYPKELVFDANGGTQTFKIQSNNTPWYIRLWGASEWAKIDISEGNTDTIITVTVLPYYEQTDRYAKVSLTDNSMYSDSLKIIQTKKDIVILSTAEEIKAFKIQGQKHLTSSLMIKGNEITTLNTLGNLLEQIDGDLILQCGNLTTLDGLYNLKNIGGNLIIDRGNLSSMEGLNNLESIGKDFKITPLPYEENKEHNNYFDSFTSFKGLEKLKFIGGSFIIESQSTTFVRFLNYLVSFEGLNHLETIGKNFSFSAAATGLSCGSCLNSLKSFKGLEALKSIGGNFTIKAISATEFSYSLVQLNSFENLSNLETIGGNLEIISEASNVSRSLTGLKIKGLGKLKNIGGNMSIVAQNYYTNDDESFSRNSLTSINSLEGFKNLKTISGDIEIKFCRNLENIDDLINLTALQGNITIEKCKALYDFCVLKPLLEDSESTIYTNGNGYNPTKYQILNGECSKQPK